MQIPSSTYRIQLNKEFTMEQLQAILDYLHQLGITTVYASPITTATPGSLHGYDVTDPHSINPEIGSIAIFKTIGDQLAAKRMSWLQDIVPNHMGFAPSNEKLMDVLEQGDYSDYNHWFDINRSHPAPDLQGKVMVPFLGDELEACIEKGDIKIVYASDHYFVQVYDSRYPFSSGVKTFLESMDILGEELVDYINNDKEKLKALLQEQEYVLTHWKRTMREINYRRFFTVNSLICLRMEDEMVFMDYHIFLQQLAEYGLLQGLRIDHIDGLYDPTQYIAWLRKAFGEDMYIIAEKILEAHEKIPPNWKLQGTSGYEYLAYTNRLLTSMRGAEQLVKLYQELLPGIPSYHDQVTQNKTLILEKYIAGEWENLTRYFSELGLLRQFDREKIKQALAAVMIAMPVYRIYPDEWPLQGENARIMKMTFDNAKKSKPDYRQELEYLEKIFTGSEEPAGEALLFVKRVMQFTGPLTAKGVEDTTFYVYNPLISHNEVGDDPSLPAISVENFHEIMSQRLQHTALSLNATATHDTKRGEDARLRINVLGELASEWQQKVDGWFAMNNPFNQTINGNTAPSINDEYFIYQAIIGGFPEDYQVTDEWIERFEAFMVKAVREAKVNSNWEEPNEEYEKACGNFIRRLFNPKHTFLPDILPFVRKVAEYASIYSLAQVVLKITSPGIPDIYQGCELWDLSFVDPDNRRPVDYERRKEMLNRLIEKEKEGNKALIAFIKEHWSEGYEKLFVTWKLLQFRQNNAALFERGEYIPIEITGKETEAIAYARRLEDRQIVVIAPLAIAGRYMNRNTLVKKWTGTLELPVDVPGKWRNIFTGESFISGGQLALQDVFESFPVAVLSSD